MPRVVLTAEVQDSRSWEKAYRSHGALFRQLWEGPFPNVHFTATDTNEVAMFMEVDDLDKYFAMLKRPEIAEAMKHDGVNRDTVKVYVLDKSASF
jgi:hypothetical protein